jgi:hypothetical protein
LTQFLQSIMLHSCQRSCKRYILNLQGIFVNFNTLVQEIADSSNLVVTTLHDYHIVIAVNNLLANLGH